jgi:hypothetical protein
LSVRSEPSFLRTASANTRAHAISADSDAVSLRLSVSGITKVLFFAIASLVAAYLVSESLVEAGVQPIKLRTFFSLDSEANPAAWFSSLQLLFSAILLTVIARKGYGDSHPGYWAGLAIIFYYLALDEGAQIHELLNPVFRRATGVNIRNAWVLLAIPMIAVLGLGYLRFLVRLPRRTAIQFAIGGSIFLMGAMGVEAIGGGFLNTTIARGPECELSAYCHYGYRVTVAVEEGMEMAGISIFVNALLRILLLTAPRFQFKVHP